MTMNNSTWYWEEDEKDKEEEEINQCSMQMAEKPLFNCIMQYSSLEYLRLLSFSTSCFTLQDPE